VNNEVAIQLYEVSKFYGQRAGVLELSAEIPRGAFVGLLGPNGAGKSTTLRILACCIPPSSGTAKVWGFDVFHESVEVRKRLGYLPENCPLYPEMRVLEYLQWTAHMKGLDPGDVDKAVYDVLKPCAIEHVRGQFIGTLSKGYRQRVGLASVLIHQPAVLILDEPTLGLDPLQVREFRSLISSLKGRHTVLISSHILSQIDLLCDQVIILNEGRGVASGSPEALRAHVTHRYGVECRNHPSLTALLPRLLDALPGAEMRDYLPSGDFVRFVLCTNEHDPRLDVHRFFTSAGIEVRELTHEPVTLEDVFVHYTAGKQAALQPAPSPEETTPV